MLALLLIVVPTVLANHFEVAGNLPAAQHVSDLDPHSGVNAASKPTSLQRIKRWKHHGGAFYGFGSNDTPGNARSEEDPDSMDHLCGPKGYRPPTCLAYLSKLKLKNPSSLPKGEIEKTSEGTNT